MGKHKNRDQSEILLRFMERRLDLAKGFAKGDRVCHEKDWEELAVDLNAAGPPVKDVAVWKKTWADWKVNIRKRLSHNKTELRKTGAGRFNQYVLTPVEEEIATICGLHQAVEGIPNAKTLCGRKGNLPRNDTRDLPSTSRVALSELTTNVHRNDACGLPTTSSLYISQVDAEMEVDGDTSALVNDILLPLTPPARGTAVAHISPVSSPTISPNIRTRRRRGFADIGDFLEMERENFDKLTEKVSKLTDEVVENRRVFWVVGKNIKYISRDIRNMSKDMKEIRLLKEKKYEELKRHHYRMEQSNKTKNELKLQFLELEKLKLGVSSQ